MTAEAEPAQADPGPVCGEDFCEMCGDCLFCFGDDPCLDDGSHVWP